MRPLLNFALFQCAWFAAILGGANGWPLLGALPALGVAAFHLWHNRRRIRQEILLAAAVTALGTCVEGGFMAAGVLNYTGTAHGQLVPPLWIIALWLAFATLPNESLTWLKGHWPLQALLGGIAGSLTYLGGAGLGAAALSEPVHLNVIAIGIAWGLVLPAIFLLAEQFNPRAGFPRSGR